ncbi:transmembrane protein 70, mitochondrial [Thalassophryne amazonica]|uniref:transmembrane protein 70, mitochondrial n=1 Tax=Thalassophryne amazonica TaxID=390379 RepID=UPI001471CCD9|nr:transmembrane protein 70, mitochondrial [Thalassophryne amazonica]
MIVMNISRRLRLYSVYQCCGNVLLSDAFSCGRLSGSRAAAARWSKFNQRNKIESCCPVSHFSTATSSDGGKLIYTGSLGKVVLGVKLFSYTSSGLSLILIPHILLQSSTGLSGFAHAAFCCCIGFFTFCTPILLHLITKGYVVRLYHNVQLDTYTAITYSLALTEKRTVFHQSQVRIPAISKMLTTFYADRMGLLVSPEQFPVPQDYNHLMGYDRPFTFTDANMEEPDKSH